MRDKNNNQIPEYLADTYEMLKCAFPEHVPPEEYFPLLAVLNEQMSFRNIATVMSFLTDYSYEKVYNDVLGIESTYLPAFEEKEQLKQKLIPCGYKIWVDKD